jgi:hypothetical protein
MLRARALAAIAILSCGFSAKSAEWKPVTGAELAMKAPLVEKDAPAEAIFWKVRVADAAAGQDLQTSRSHYLRIKIFNEKGREYAKISLTYGGKTNFSGVSGRTIKPDGSIVEMKKDAIFDIVAVKSKTVKVKSRSFTLPDVQPGDIIEYQWREIETGVLSNYMRLPLPRDIPVEAVRYFIKPFTSA